MVGIKSYGAYIPIHRLGQGTKGWVGRGERAVANFDEDSLTMGVAAGLNSLAGEERNKIEALYFASTSCPYHEKQAASTAAVACDLYPGVYTSDYANSLRAGTIALKSAIDAVKAGAAKQVLVIASDMRSVKTADPLEFTIGDGAAAFIVEDSPDVAVTIEDHFGLSSELLDTWRIDGGHFVRSWEDRFALDVGYFQVFREAVDKLMHSHNLTSKDIDKAVLYAPNARRHDDMAKRLGFDSDTQVQAPLFGVMGNTGASFALILLIAALEKAKAGETILLANYGDGADAFILRVTEKIERLRNRRGVNFHLNSKKIVDDYLMRYARWRGLVDIWTPRRPPLDALSAAALWRGQEKNLRFHGVKCKRCETPQYPPQTVCAKCHAIGEFEPYTFANRKATLFTYAADYLGYTLDPPLVVGMIDFEGGGRMNALLADCDINKVSVRMPLEMTFRKLYSLDEINTYYWKAMPLRG